jgi:hypothetical protein
VTADRECRARLANVRQELLTPVTASGRLLRAVVARRADCLVLGGPAPDLERMLTAAQDLFRAGDRLLDGVAASDQPTGADLDAIEVTG